MSVHEEFYALWVRASDIHIHALEQPLDSTSHLKIVSLSPRSNDHEAAKRWRGDIFMDGTGIRKDPFRMHARDLSPHFGVFEMWFVLRKLETRGISLCIEVNDLVFFIVPEGVVSEDGQLTKFLV